MQALFAQSLLKWQGMAAIRRMGAACLLLISSPVLCLANPSDLPTQLAWSDLVDEAAQDFEDPFRALPNDALIELAKVARMREQVLDTELPQDVRTRLRARLEASEASLADANLDVDWLISQRWIVAQKRTDAFWAGNAALDGQTVTITGFFVPAKHSESGEVMGYLVPKAGMCSHVPPPAPNQLVRLPGLGLQDMPQRPYSYVRVTGTLRLVPSSDPSQVIDGPVVMKSAWALDVDAFAKILARSMPGTVMSRRATSPSSARRAISASSPAIRSPR